MKIEHIIFDMDGTLVDSEFCSAQALVDVLPQLSIKPLELLNEFQGVKLAKILSLLAIRYDVQISPDTVDKFRKREAELTKDLITLNPGVAELLDSLRISYCIASNAPNGKTIRSLKSCGIYEYFNNSIYSAYEIDAWKPDPTLFLHAARCEGFHPSQCLVIEDSDVGLSAAKSANMHPVFYNPHKRGTEHLTVKSVYSLVEILDLLN